VSRAGHPGEMSCREMVEHLSDYLDGELDAALQRTIEAHGGECPPCRVFIRTLRKTVEAVRSLPREPLPPAARRALVRALLQARSRRP
jgi:anti-sigma factor RsiW